MKAWPSLALALAVCLAVVCLPWRVQSGPVLAVPSSADFDFSQAEPLGTHLFLPIIMNSYTSTLPVPADIIFHNGIVLTMEASPQQAQAIAIRGQRIVAVGANAEILALQGHATQLIDLHGLTLTPGFIDPHTHLLNDANKWGVNLEGAQQIALQNGVTMLGSMYTLPDFLAQMQDLDHAGRLRVRTSLYLNYTTNCGQVLGDWYKAYPPARAAGAMLRIGGVKLFLDGGSCGRPAFSYDHPIFGYGDLWFTQDQLNAAVASIHASGYQVALHALGDRAVEQALNAIEYALDGQPNSLRHRIEHNAVVRDDMLHRYAEVDPVSLIFGAYPCGIGNAAPSPQQSWEWRWQDLLAANPDGHITWHSDAPLSPVSPLLNLYSMVTSHQVSSNGTTICDAPAGMAAKTLTVRQVLPMMTIEAAYALLAENEVGSLKPGKLADLVILSANPLVVDPEQIKDIKVQMTMVGGHVEYCAPTASALCPSGTAMDGR